METNRPLLAKIAHPETLLSAWRRVHTKRAAGGLDGVSVEEFTRDLDANLDELRRELLEERYVPEPLQQVAIPKGPDRRETRTLHLPSVRDKVAQEAARSVLEPILNRLFLDCSYGYRPGKGPHRAIARVTHYLANLKRHWVVTADIDDFFGSLDQTLLLDRLRPVVQDEAVLRLIRLWLQMGAVDGRGRWHDVYSGVGQGMVISPLLANFYLHPFDEQMVGAGFGLVRYADDFVILCGERSEAEDALVKATTFLETLLGLRLNPNPCPISTITDGFGFLGIFFQGDRRLIEAGKLEKMAATVRRVTGVDDLWQALRDLNEAVVGWRRYYGSLVSPEELAKIDQFVTGGLVGLIAQGFRQGRWRSLDEAEAALQGIETISQGTPEQRRALIGRIVREGKARAKEKPAHSFSGTVRDKKRRRPRRGSVGAHPRESVAGVVRRAKRRHHRQLAQISELVLNTPGCFLGKTRQRVVVRQDRRNICEIPASRLTGITVASRGVALSADLIEHCAENDIPVLFLSPQGKVVAVLSAPESSRGATGLLQLRALEEGRPALELAKRFVEGKIRNQMNLMKYFHKYRKRVDLAFTEAFSQHMAAMSERLRELAGLQYTGDYEAARGQLFSIEGRVAQEYWALVGLLLRGRAEFPGRQRQGATDLVNSLLNYSYALLQSRVYLAVLKAGLTPQISFLHAFQRKGQPTLVFDLMEEFRPQLVDRAVLTMLARREKLSVDDQGLLTEETRRRLIAQIHDRLATLIRFRGKELKVDEVIQHQAQLLVRHLKGEARYRPFVAKW